MPISGCNPTQFVTVDKTEEKGSDVNLATHLLLDAFKNSFDVALIISNDSDLAEPVRVVRDEFKKNIIILNPHKKFSAELVKYSSFRQKIKAHHLANCQFPPKLTDSNGRIYKPKLWNNVPPKKHY